MWCHLCKVNFTDSELFKCHILKEHRPESEFYRVRSSDSEGSEPENTQVPENVDPAVEVHSEDDTTNVEDDMQHSFESCSDVSSSQKGLSRSVRKKPRRKKFTHTKKSIQKVKTHSSQKDSVAIKEQNSKPSTSNNQFNGVSPAVSQMLGQQQPLIVINPTHPDMTQLIANGGFELNSENILQWLRRHRELCQNLKYPLPHPLYKKIKLIHKLIFSLYSMASPSREGNAVVNVYEDLDSMILKHIEHIHEEI